MCPAFCSSKAENEMKLDSEGYCKGELWHDDILDAKYDSGHVAEGHHFGCRHYKHIILIVDCSGSMSLRMKLTSEAIQPINQKEYGRMLQTHSAKRPTRLETVKAVSMDFLTELNRSSQDFIVSFITFSNSPRLIVNSADITYACQQLTATDWSDMKEGGTRYYSAIAELESLLNSQSHSIARGSTRYEPAVFFLSDGETREAGLDHAVSELVEQRNATFSTCLFGDDNKRAQTVLTSMSKSGRGQFYRAPTGADLRSNLHNFKACLYTTKAISGY